MRARTHRMAVPMSRPRTFAFLAVAATLTMVGGTLQPSNASPIRPQDALASQPERVLDTRSRVGAGGKSTLGRIITFGVPAAAAAGASTVVLNITATDALGAGWAKAWPCGEPMPNTSTVNYVPGRTSAN